MNTPPMLSVVVPVYNEAGNLHPLRARLIPVLEQVAGADYEVLFVDDGSRDESPAILGDFNRDNPRLRAVHLSRNFGHQAALQAGLDRAAGRAIVLMDADLQDPPELLPEFVQRWREGFDVVYAVRRTRRERAWKRLAYHVFYRVLKATAAIDAPLDAGDFCLMDTRVARTIATMPEQHRFLRGLRAWVGFRQTGVEYDPKTGQPRACRLRRVLDAAAAGGRLARLRVRHRGLRPCRDECHRQADETGGAAGLGIDDCRHPVHRRIAADHPWRDRRVPRTRLRRGPRAAVLHRPRREPGHKRTPERLTWSGTSAAVTKRSTSGIGGFAGAAACSRPSSTASFAMGSHAR
jgi:hypothetical protein